jgi:hypothetical protein
MTESNQTPVLDLLATMTAASIETTKLVNSDRDSW